MLFETAMVLLGLNVSLTFKPLCQKFQAYEYKLLFNQTCCHISLFYLISDPFQAAPLTDDTSQAELKDGELWARGLDEMTRFLGAKGGAELGDPDVLRCSAGSEAQSS